MELQRSGRPRVVLTGLGAISPMGNDVPSLWDGLLAGRSATRRITAFDASKLPSQVGGEVHGFDPLIYINKKDVRRWPRGAQFAVAAAQQAVDDAGLDVGEINLERAGVLVGTGMGALDNADFHIQKFRREGYDTVSPFAMPSSLPNMWSLHVSMRFGMSGPMSTVSTACATGTMAIGQATDWIRNGRADVVVAGGVETMMQDFAVAGFAAMRALSTGFNESPERASRPFDLNRDGFVFSEGGGIVILESLEHALARSANIYCEVLGYGLASDAFHIVAPDPSGEGYLRAMRRAVDDAGINPDKIDLVSAHASSTQLNDATETIALKRLMGERAYKVPVNAAKSMLGHSLGGAAGLEAIACALMFRDGVAHPTINYETPDPDCDLDYIPNEARDVKADIILDNSFAMGGNNACLVLGRI